MSISMRILILVLCLGFILFPRIIGKRIGSIPPLITAVLDLNIEKARSLLEHGADAELADDDGNTALHYALQAGDDKEARRIMRLLIKYNANVRARNKRGLTPLHFMPQIDNTDVRMEVLGDLVKNGAQIGARDNQGLTVIDYLVQARNQGDIEVFMDEWYSATSSDTIIRAQNQAKEFGFTDILKVLDQKKDLIGKKDATAFNKKTGLTALMFAIIRGDKKMVIGLLKRRANPNKYSDDRYRHRPLHFSLLHQDVTLLSPLLERGAKVKETNKAGDTPLHLIVHVLSDVQRKRAAEILLEAGADINIKNEDGDTLIHLIVKTNDIALMEFLFDNYLSIIDLAVKNNKGNTPLELAKKLKRKELMGIFELIVSTPSLLKVPI